MLDSYRRLVEMYKILGITLFGREGRENACVLLNTSVMQDIEYGEPELVMCASRFTHAQLRI